MANISTMLTQILQSQADRGETISAGNFHGEYPAKAVDYLAIGVYPAMH